jgi:DNA-binding XRE family transcriptional regulator
MTLKERVKEIISDLNISQSMFEDAIGASRGTIAHLENTISSKLLTKITTKFPQVSSDWVLTGRGEKYLDAIPATAEQTERKEVTSSRTRELLNEIEKQRLIIARFQSQIERANEQINKCQEHINILSTAIAKEV